MRQREHLRSRDSRRRLLCLDIETAPNTAHVWELWNQNIGLNQLLESGYVLCWAAKWIGDPEIHFSSIKDGRRKMLRKVHQLLAAADAVISWNGLQFDIPTLNKEFLEVGMRPPAPFQQIDLMLTAKKRFRFPSNKLEYVARRLRVGQKIKHEGHELWIKCMAGSRKAWKTMRRYNINDAVLLESVYEKLLPWITNHPHVGVHEASPAGCPNCGSEELLSRGYAYTSLGKYRRFVCRKCGLWTRAIRRVTGATVKAVA